MPIRLALNSPAARQLAAEGVDVIEHAVAVRQDIRPLRIALLNLMPNKVNTEVQLARLLSNTPLQVELTLLSPATHTAKTTSPEYLEEFYKAHEAVMREKFDGLIVTGAPVEQMPFTDVTYWNELRDFMDKADSIAFRRMYICWGAQAALWHKYGVQRELFDQKLFGVYEQTLKVQGSNALRGFPDRFVAPVSRYAMISEAECERHDALKVLASSPITGVSIAESNDGELFVCDHYEYDTNSLGDEYSRDLSKGMATDFPRNYYVNDSMEAGPTNDWRSQGFLLFHNWIYRIYENVPYDLSTLPARRE
jgi:homoserine O-succinyltransferase/O-acetyltransferase